MKRCSASLVIKEMQIKTTMTCLFTANRMAIIKKMDRAEARRATTLQPVEQKPHSQKDRQDEKAEDYVPDEGTR